MLWLLAEVEAHFVGFECGEHDATVPVGGFELKVSFGFCDEVVPTVELFINCRPLIFSRAEGQADQVISKKIFFERDDFPNIIPENIEVLAIEMKKGKSIID